MNIPNPVITSGALPASRKIYVDGDIHPEIRVPMREIAVHPTAGENPLPVYDSSGPRLCKKSVIFGTILLTAGGHDVWLY